MTEAPRTAAPPGSHPDPAPPLLPAVSPAWLGAARVVLGAYGHLVHRLCHWNAHHVPCGGRLLVVSNHPTYMDPVLIGLGTRRPIHWLAWEGLFRWPLVGPVLPRLGTVPLDTGHPGASSLRICADLLEDDRALGLFFEGRRSNGPLLNPLKQGAARLALRTGTPVLPVSVTGAFRCWPKTRALPRPGRIVVVFHPPIPVERRDTRDTAAERALTARIEAAILSALPPDGTPATRRPAPAAPSAPPASGVRV